MKIFHLFITFIQCLNQRIRAACMVLSTDSAMLKCFVNTKAAVAHTHGSGIARFSWCMSLYWCFSVMGVLSLTPVSTGYAAIPASERAVLEALYTGTAGTSWFNQLNWNGPAGTECSWHGVTCSAGGVNVTGIKLNGNNLRGSLPVTLNQLTQLITFETATNALSGNIPALTGLASLRHFNVAGNRLTGSIPSLTGLAILEEFFANKNELTGLPDFTGLTSLYRFSAKDNLLNGTIPALTGLTALGIFNLDNNLLTGNIPALAGLTGLLYFEVSNNRLTGNLPALTGLTKLIIFRVDDNQLTGPISAAPSPTNNLEDRRSRLCPNQLTVSVDRAWDAATGSSPWSQGCAIETFVGERCSLDLDGNGAIQPQTDGVMWLRIMLGFRGDAVMQVALGSGATRSTWPQIQSFLFNHCGIR
jgi:hypothetical protein